MFASVIIDQDTRALDKIFEYIVPDDMQIEKGMRVFVPFGSRVLQGFVVDIKGSCEYDVSKLISPTNPAQNLKTKLLLKQPSKNIQD